MTLAAAVHELRMIPLAAAVSTTHSFIPSLSTPSTTRQFTNANATDVKTAFGATGIRFKNQRPSSGRIKWGMQEIREWNRVRRRRRRHDRTIGQARRHAMTTPPPPPCMRCDPDN